jgi:hypothetical protein
MMVQLNIELIIALQCNVKYYDKNNTNNDTNIIRYYIGWAAERGGGGVTGMILLVKIIEISDTRPSSQSSTLWAH